MKMNMMKGKTDNEYTVYNIPCHRRTLQTPTPSGFGQETLTESNKQNKQQCEVIWVKHLTRFQDLLTYNIESPFSKILNWLIKIINNKRWWLVIYQIIQKLLYLVTYQIKSPYTESHTSLQVEVAGSDQWVLGLDVWVELSGGVRPLPR